MPKQTGEAMVHGVALRSDAERGEGGWAQDRPGGGGGGGGGGLRLQLSDDEQNWRGSNQV